ncbi:PREDICTED: LOC110808305 isoform [Prunus dulcis]|uniref:PREDICTED: LOC110808305 isoform n=1 Tax=Prunus dulcis TaxID=3755 RepID=A0A5E4G9B0_PRUDU|nr:PREDICTED: LOC110808305 isoform [Prunus dulcis]
MMSSRIISSVLVDRIQEEPFIKPVDIVKDFKQNYFLDISYHTAWHAKNLAKSEVHGDESSSYSQLVWYRDALMSSNRGSHCVLECDPKTSRFRRLFICYGACIEGFWWCRPLLFIDVTGLESKHKGQLIGATGKNGNQGSFPFAFAIVDSENEVNWIWFFENLAKVLTPQGRTITFISDHNKGLTEAVSNMFPTSHHAFCLQHLKQNLLSKYPSTYGKFFRDHIVDLFLKCAYAPTKAAFEVNMRNLKHEGGAPVMTFLEDLPKESWSYAYFKEQWCSVLCPVMERTLNERLMVGRNWNVSRCSASVYDVHAEICVKVDLANCLCSCHEWQIKGFPCVHALVAIQKDSGCIHEYTDDHFKSRYFRYSYAFSISPIRDIKNVMQGSEDVIMPPLTKKRRGRPTTKMPKSVGAV